VAATGRGREHQHRDQRRTAQRWEKCRHVLKCHQDSPCQVEDSPNSPGWVSTPIQSQAGCRTSHRCVPGEFLISPAFDSSLHAVWPMGGRRVFFFVFPQVNGKKIRGVFCKNVQSIATMTVQVPVTPRSAAGALDRAVRIPPIHTIPMSSEASPAFGVSLAGHLSRRYAGLNIPRSAAPELAVAFFCLKSEQRPRVVDRPIATRGRRS
jgi:hypothetical protein